MGIASKGPRIVLRELRRGCTVSGQERGSSSPMGEVTSARVVLAHGRGDLGAVHPRRWARIDRELVLRELSGIDSVVTEEIDQLVEGIYRALETTEERLDGRCDDIYFPMDLTINALTFKVEAIQGELVEIQSYIARQPEAPISIDRRINKSIDTNHSASIDIDTNRGRLVPKTTSNMSNTPYHGKEISADTYAALTRHQFNLESLGERLQRIENTTATMKDKWRRGDEAMRDFIEHEIELQGVDREFPRSEIGLR
ncbi:hypothetical protein F2Q70_00002927 [Brassica cretica]|uniref:Uncharacterized protein n=1 Tax=Brassica cretica TaxID=69181 RepID=A0A8S9IXT4_BRACR|nr:hypothetical protein F2Q70_00002927 [Brassica cretica]